MNIITYQLNMSIVDKKKLKRFLERKIANPFIDNIKVIKHDDWEIYISTIEHGDLPSLCIAFNVTLPENELNEDDIPGVFYNHYEPFYCVTFMGKIFNFVL